MKRLVYLITLVALFTSCSKSAEDVLQKDPTVEGQVNNGLEPAAYKWWGLPVPTGTGTAVESNVVIEVNGAVYCAYDDLGRTYKLNNTTRRWELYANSNGFFSNFDWGWTYLYSYQSKIFLGLLIYDNVTTSRFASYDIATNTYTELPAFPGTPVRNPTCFIIGNKGYIMGGVNDNGHPVNQLWEYNFITNVWMDKGPSPLGARTGMTAFVIDNKVYAGLGYTITYINNTAIKQYKDDWILFTPGSAYSAVKADFPGAKRAYAKGFVLNGNPYVGFGYNANGNNVYYNDFWKYNILSNTWTEQDPWPGTVGSTYVTNIHTFSVGNTGYMVKGGLNQFWGFSNSVLF